MTGAGAGAGTGAGAGAGARTGIGVGFNSGGVGLRGCGLGILGLFWLDRAAIAARPAPAAVPAMPAAMAGLDREGLWADMGGGARLESANGFGGSLNGLEGAAERSSARRSQGLLARGGVKFLPLLPLGISLKVARGLPWLARFLPPNSGRSRDMGRMLKRGAAAVADIGGRLAAPPIGVFSSSALPYSFWRFFFEYRNTTKAATAPMTSIKPIANPTFAPVERPPCVAEESFDCAELEELDVVGLAATKVGLVCATDVG